MQGGELDGNSGPSIDALTVGGLANGVNRLLVIPIVARGVIGRHRGFAKHVVGVAEAFFFELATVLERFVDGLARDELLAHKAHSHIDAAPDDGLATTLHQGVEHLWQTLCLGGGEKPAGDDEAPCGRVDEKRCSLADMAMPVAARDLVPDQGIACGGVGDAEQCLGEAHEGDPFL